ncbi:MAG: hypothetical protein ACP5HM_11260 [Anaerolineae bacterium]
MKRLFGFPKIALLLAVSLALVVSGVVLATVITVDGDPSDWPSGARLTTDPDEANVSNEWDIEDVYATNSGPASTGKAFFMVQSYGTPMEFDFADYLFICVDTDADNTTGAQVGTTGSPNACTTAREGIDSFIRIAENAYGVLYTCNTSSCSAVGSTPVWSFNASDGTIEVEETLANLGITADQDGATLPLVFYYDNDSLYDDNIPDTGYLEWKVGTGSPTAVTLSAIDAGPALASLPALALVVAAVAGGAGLFLWKRRS